VEINLKEAKFLSLTNLSDSNISLRTERKEVAEKETKIISSG